MWVVTSTQFLMYVEKKMILRIDFNFFKTSYGKVTLTTTK